MGWEDRGGDSLDVERVFVCVGRELDRGGDRLDAERVFVCVGWEDRGGDSFDAERVFVWELFVASPYKVLTLWDKCR